MGLFQSTPKPRKVIVPPPIFNPIVPPPSFYQKHVCTNNSNNSNKSTPQNKGQKRDRIPKDVRNAVWVKYHGEKNTGICYCCGVEIQRYNAGWHCSHVVASDKGGPITVENLRTCCKHCNLSMGNCNLYVYIKDKRLNGPGAKNVNNYLYRHNSQIGDKRTNNWGK